MAEKELRVASKEMIDNRMYDDVIKNYTINLESLLNEEDTEVDFLVPGCIPRGNIALLVGESGGCKTWVAYDLMRAALTGTKWMNRGMNLTKSKVLLLNYDNPTDTLKQRLIKLGFNKDMSLIIHTQGKSIKMLLLPDEIRRLNILVDRYQPHLTIVDSFRQSNTFNENDSQEMAELMGHFKKWTNTESKNTVVILHHTPKANTTGGWPANARGSGEIISSSDVVMEVSNKTISWTKSRTWEIGEVDPTKFEVIDEYTEESIVTHVNATSNLPGEENRTVYDRVINLFLTEKKILLRNDIYLKCRPLKRIAIDIAIKQGICNKKIKRVHLNHGHAYELA